MTPTAAPKADRFSNRAPKGGMVSPVNGVFYKGGQFMPMAPAEFKPGPAALMGSVRQIQWANRLRNEALARLDRAILDANALLAVAGRKEAPVVRAARKTLVVARHNLTAERSAARLIDLHRAQA